MARPKDSTASVSAAFLEKNSREEGRLRHKIKASLQKDIRRLYKEGLHSDLTLTCGLNTISLHSAILKSRLKERFDQVLKQLQSTRHSQHDLDEIVSDIYGGDDHQLNQALGKLGVRSDIDIDAEKENVENTPENKISDLQNHVDIECDTTSKRNGSENGKGKFDFMVYDGEPCSPLGSDLLQIYLQGIDSDIVLVAEGHEFKVHKSVLSVRSIYFEAMLGHGWMESEKNLIELEYVSNQTVDCALRYIYGGAVTVNCDLQKYLHMADMYGMEGLKEAVIFILKRDVCHFFHKPCSVCTEGVPDTLTLAYMYDLSDLVERCIKWVNKNLTRVWKSKSFLNLPDEVVQNCLTSAVHDINMINVVNRIMDCDKLMSSVSSTTTNQRCVDLASKLMENCVDFVRHNLVTVFESEQFLSLSNNMAWGLVLMDNVMGRAIMTLPLDKACEAYQCLCKLTKYCEDEEYCSWSDEFKELIRSLHGQCGQFMILNINILHGSSQWHLMPPSLQREIREKASYVYIGDSAKIKAQPPKLSSATKPFQMHKSSIRKEQSASTKKLPAIPGSSFSSRDMNGTKQDMSKKTHRVKSTFSYNIACTKIQQEQNEAVVEIRNGRPERLARMDSVDDTESVLSLHVNTSVDSGSTYKPYQEVMDGEFIDRPAVLFTFEVLPIFNVLFDKPY